MSSLLANPNRAIHVNNTNVLKWLGLRSSEGMMIWLQVDLLLLIVYKGFYIYNTIAIFVFLLSRLLAIGHCG
jgi:hypothetical protein